MSAKDTLEIVAGKINEMVKKSDEYVILAAILVHEARQRVKSGEAGPGVRWEAWAAANIKLSKSRIRELQRIGDADDPNAELERIRGRTRERVQRHREKSAEQKTPLRNGARTADESLEPERRQLIEWATDASLEDVRRVLTEIQHDHLEIPGFMDRRNRAA